VLASEFNFADKLNSRGVALIWCKNRVWCNLM
jgi:hypothetical protein